MFQVNEYQIMQIQSLWDNFFAPFLVISVSIEIQSKVLFLGFEFWFDPRLDPKLWSFWLKQNYLWVFQLFDPRFDPKIWYFFQ